MVTQVDVGQVTPERVVETTDMETESEETSEKEKEKKQSETMDLLMNSVVSQAYRGSHRTHKTYGKEVRNF